MGESWTGVCREVKGVLEGKPVVVFYLFVNVRGALSSPLRSGERSSTEYFKPGLYVDLSGTLKHWLWQRMLPRVFCLQKNLEEGRSLQGFKGGGRTGREGCCTGSLQGVCSRGGGSCLCTLGWGSGCKAGAPGCQHPLDRGREGLGQQLKASWGLSGVQGSCGQCQSPLCACTCCCNMKSPLLQVGQAASPSTPLRSIFGSPP